MITQPTYLPWLGYYSRVARADHLIYLDDVQWRPRYFQHRNKIKTKDGERWLTLPVEKHQSRAMLCDVQLADADWQSEHLRLIHDAYRSSPYLDELPTLPQQRNLCDLNIELDTYLLCLFGLDIPRTLSSKMSTHDANPSARLAALTKCVGGTHYIAGVGSRDYLDEFEFTRRDITVIWDDWKHPVYPQMHGDFISGLSAIDLLLNCNESERASYI